MQVAQQQPELAAELAAIQAEWLARKDRAKQLIAGLEDRREAAVKTIKDLQSSLAYTAALIEIGDTDYPMERFTALEAGIDKAKCEIAWCDHLAEGLPALVRQDFIQDARRRKVEQRIRQEATNDAGNSGETRAILPEKQEGNRRKSPARLNRVNIG